MPSEITDYWALLEALAKHEVEAIVIGGVCAVLRGAPVNTFDLDIVPRREPENLTRLLAALEELDAYYREAAHRRLRPSLAHLASPGHQLLMTRFGALDVLGTTTGDRSYEDLLPHATEMTLRDDLTVRVLDLPMLIRLKEETNRDKDRVVLPILRHTLAEEQRRKG